MEIQRLEGRQVGGYAGRLQYHTILSAPSGTKAAYL